MAWWDQLVGPGRDVAAAIISLFEEMGLGTLAPRIIEYAQQGYGGETITLLLQDTPEYKKRFRANEMRQKAGLPVLSPAEYIQMERAYRGALQSAGLPAGFYDSEDDFVSFLARDISPSEIAERANMAAEVANTLDQPRKEALAQFYGIDSRGLAAYLLDANRALPVLREQLTTSLLGAERARAGLGLDRAQAERLFNLGVSVDQARQGYGTIARELPGIQRLGEISRDPITVGDLEREVFGGDAAVTRRRGRLASEERARLSGSTGTGRTTLTRERTFN